MGLYVLNIKEKSDALSETSQWGYRKYISHSTDQISEPDLTVVWKPINRYLSIIGLKAVPCVVQGKHKYNVLQGHKIHSQSPDISAWPVPKSLRALSCGKGNLLKRNLLSSQLQHWSCELSGDRHFPNCFDQKNDWQTKAFQYKEYFWWGSPQSQIILMFMNSSQEVHSAFSVYLCDS